MSQTEVESLQRWLNQEPLLESKQFSHARGMAATRDLPPDTVIMKIPYDKMFSYQKDCADFREKYHDKMNNSNSLLAWKWHTQSNPKDFYHYNRKWYVYRSTLQGAEKYHSLLLSPNRLKYIEELPFYQNFIEWKKQILTDYQFLAEKLQSRDFPISWRQFVKARTVLTSRVFGFTRNGDNDVALVPYADLLNHREPPNTRWYFHEPDQTFRVETTTEIPKGSEVFDTYGKKDNSLMWMYYGFTHPEHHFQTRSLSETSKRFQKRWTRLRKKILHRQKRGTRKNKRSHQSIKSSQLLSPHPMEMLMPFVKFDK